MAVIQNENSLKVLLTLNSLKFALSAYICTCNFAQKLFILRFHLRCWLVQYLLSVCINTLMLDVTMLVLYERLAKLMWQLQLRKHTVVLVFFHNTSPFLDGHALSMQLILLLKPLKKTLTFTFRTIDCDLLLCAEAWRVDRFLNRVRLGHILELSVENVSHYECVLNFAALAYDLLRVEFILLHQLDRIPVQKDLFLMFYFCYNFVIVRFVGLFSFDTGLVGVFSYCLRRDLVRLIFENISSTFTFYLKRFEHICDLRIQLFSLSNRLMVLTVKQLDFVLSPRMRRQF